MADLHDIPLAPVNIDAVAADAKARAESAIAGLDSDAADGSRDKHGQNRKPKRDARGRWIGGGPSPNPKGRKPGRTLSEWLRHMADEPHEVGQPPRAEAMARKLWSLGLDGDLRAIELIFVRLEGKPSDNNALAITAPIIIELPDIGLRDDTTPSGGPDDESD